MYIEKSGAPPDGTAATVTPVQMPSNAETAAAAGSVDGSSLQYRQEWEKFRVWWREIKKRRSSKVEQGSDKFGKKGSALIVVVIVHGGERHSTASHPNI
jgi:hypothetical protein